MGILSPDRPPIPQGSQPRWERCARADLLACVAVGACGRRLGWLVRTLTGLDRVGAAASGAHQPVHAQGAHASVPDRPSAACTPVQGPAPHRPHGAPGRALARWPVPCPPRGFPPMLSLALPRRVRSRVAHRCAPSPSGSAPRCLSLAASSARCAPRRTSNSVPRPRGWQRSGSARALMGRGAPAPGRYAASSGADSTCRAHTRAFPPCTMFSSPGLTGRQRHNGSAVRNRARCAQPLWPRWRWRLRLYVHLENHKVADPMLEAPFPPPASAHPTC